MLRRVFFAVGVSSLLIAAPLSVAGAADMSMPLKAPYSSPPSTYTWSGCYIDAGFGYGMYGLNTGLVDATTGAALNAELDQSGKGWLGRFGGGCDYQLGGSLSSWVIGAFGDFDTSDIEGSHTGADPSVVGLDSGNMKLRDSWSAGGRIGYIVFPQLMTYFDGGYTQAHFGGTTYATVGGAPDGFGVGSQTYSGWFLGGGTEYALNFSWLPIPGLFWRNEYRFSEYDAKNLTVFATATGAPTGVLENTKPYVQTITSSLVWRFNWMGR
jgi:outer membrane immunogenic protein